MWIEADSSARALPSASTCARELYVPAYGDAALLQQKLEQAMEHGLTDGFQKR